MRECLFIFSSFWDFFFLILYIGNKYEFNIYKILNEKWSRPTRVKKSAKSRVNFIFPKVFSYGSEMKMDIEDFKEKKIENPLNFLEFWYISWWMICTISLHWRQMKNLFTLTYIVMQCRREKKNQVSWSISYYIMIISIGSIIAGVPFLFHHCIIIVHIWKILAFIHCFPISNLTSRYSIRIYLMYWHSGALVGVDL